MDRWVAFKSEGVQGAVAICGASEQLVGYNGGIIASGHNAVIAAMLQIGYTSREAAIMLPELGTISKLISGTCLSLIFDNMLDYCYKVRIGAIFGALVANGETITFSQLKERADGQKLYVFNPMNETYFNSDDDPDMEVREALAISLMNGNGNENGMGNGMIHDDDDDKEVTTVEVYDDSPRFTMQQVFNLRKHFTEPNVPLPDFAANDSSTIYVDISGLRTRSALMVAGKNAVLHHDDSDSDNGFRVPIEIDNSDEFVLIG